MSTDTLNLPPDLKEALDQAVAAIVEIARPRLVILFGSWAEGKAREGSDVDLLVVAPSRDTIRLGVEIDRAIRPVLRPRAFDLLVYTPQEWRSAKRIVGFTSYEADHYGVRLYDQAA
jgi:predicted nucleotidyltransferase